MSALRRRLPIVAAGAILALTVVAGPATASEPVFRDRPDLWQAAFGSRRAASHDAGTPSYTPQAFPGAKGSLIYQRAPFNAYPSQIWMAGTTNVALTTTTVGTGDSWPSWSPGGTLIAFTRDSTSSTTDGDAYDIYTMKPDGTAAKRLTNGGKADYNASFSPDGARLVFVSERTGAGDIYSMAIDGTDVKRLTTSSAFDGMPRWSPDGKRIAFVSERSGNDDIYTMDPDGSGVTRLTTTSTADFSPDWDPDGGSLLFTTNRLGQLDIFRMTSAGGSQTNRTAGSPDSNLYGRYDPTGATFQYTSDPFGDFDIYSVPLVGGIPDAVLESDMDEYNAEWQPKPSFPLVDARFSTFDADIHWVYDQGITKGCSAERYCPNDTVTRSQMASFLVRALDLPATDMDFFTDDEGLPAEGDIDRVAAAGITSGCAVQRYCPGDPVLRGAMASFLARAFALAATDHDFFTDDAGTTHEANINKVAAAGITSGCTATTYCPDKPVTRGQMAAFLRRALT